MPGSDSFSCFFFDSPGSALSAYRPLEIERRRFACFLQVSDGVSGRPVRAEDQCNGYLSNISRFLCLYRAERFGKGVEGCELVMVARIDLWKLDQRETEDSDRIL